MTGSKYLAVLNNGILFPRVVGNLFEPKDGWNQSSPSLLFQAG